MDSEFNSVMGMRDSKTSACRLPVRPGDFLEKAGIALKRYANRTATAINPLCDINHYPVNGKKLPPISYSPSELLGKNYPFFRQIGPYLPET
jgi:hypothetical protein